MERIHFGVGKPEFDGINQGKIIFLTDWMSETTRVSLSLFSKVTNTSKH